MTPYQLSSEAWLPQSIEEVFAFFSDARNLGRLTPPWLRFEITTPAPIAMAAGSLIDYKLRIHGIPIRWQSEITVWEPPFRFVDEQRRGPYSLWRHEHRFIERDGGTVVHDEVRYAMWGGALVNRLLVGRDLRTIFEYRSRELERIFNVERSNQTSASVLIQPVV